MDFRGSGLVAVRHTFPLKAQLTQAEIIAGTDVKDHHFGFKHHLLLGFAPCRDPGDLILGWQHLQHQRNAGGQAQRILPREGDFAGGIDRLGFTDQTAVEHGGGLPVDLGLDQFPAGGSLESSLRAFEQGDRSTAHLGDRFGFIVQILRKFKPDLQGGQFRPGPRFKADGLPHVSDLDEQVTILFLGGKR